MNLNKENILIVDDDPDIIDVIEIYLNNEGHQVFKASNGTEALSIIDKNIIHLILLDIMMPSMDGFEVCRRIRKKSNIPIIVLSAKSNDIDKIFGLGTGADDYIVKPFNPLEMVARVKSQLRRYLYLENRGDGSQGYAFIIICLLIPVNLSICLVDNFSSFNRFRHLSLCSFL